MVVVLSDILFIIRFIFLYRNHFTFILLVTNTTVQLVNFYNTVDLTHEPEASKETY